MEKIGELIQKARDKAANESYYHRTSKETLGKWFDESPDIFGIENPISIRYEEHACTNGIVFFVPDVCIYSTTGLSAIFEVVHTNNISNRKIELMSLYFSLMGINPSVFEISTHWILKQTKTPSYLLCNSAILNTKPKSNTNTQLKIDRSNKLS